MKNFTNLGQFGLLISCKPFTFKKEELKDLSYKRPNNDAPYVVLYDKDNNNIGNVKVDCCNIYDNNKQGEFIYNYQDGFCIPLTDLKSNGLFMMENVVTNNVTNN